MAKIKRPGGLFVFLGTVCWSLSAPLVKLIALDSLVVAGLRALIAGLVLLPALIAHPVKWNRWTAVYVVSYGTLSICIVYAMRMTSSIIAVGMQFTGVIWLFLAGLLTKKTTFSWRLLFPILIVLGGVACFMSTGTSRTGMLGNLIAAFESVLFAGTTASAKRLSDENPLALSSLAGLCTGLFVFLFLPPSFGQLTALTGRDWVIMLVLGVVQIGGGYTFYNMGVRYISAQKASILALWEMILGPIWVAVFLHEYPTLMVVIGSVVVVGGIIADALLNAPADPPADPSAGAEPGKPTPQPPPTG